MENYKSNPFPILGLPTDATEAEIVSRANDLDQIAETEEDRLRYRWATEQLITHPLVRLKHELFEMPEAIYEDDEWDSFVRRYKKIPVNAKTIALDSSEAGSMDFHLEALIRFVLHVLLQTPQGDIAEALDVSPFLPGEGLPAVEVRDVIFG